MCRKLARKSAHDESHGRQVRGRGAARAGCLARPQERAAKRAAQFETPRGEETEKEARNRPQVRPFAALMRVTALIRQGLFWLRNRPGETGRAAPMRAATSAGTA